jgi:hypothetical protein
MCVVFIRGNYDPIPAFLFVRSPEKNDISKFERIKGGAIHRDAPL